MDAPVGCHQAGGNGGSNTTEGILTMSYAESRRIIDVDSHVIELDDFLHNPEGTSDPIRKFEATMTDCDQKTMDAFYYGNMADRLGLPL